jgi:hypothetical protein
MSLSIDDPVIADSHLSLVPGRWHHGNSVPGSRDETGDGEGEGDGDGDGEGEGEGDGEGGDSVVDGGAGADVGAGRGADVCTGLGVRADLAFGADGNDGTGLERVGPGRCPDRMLAAAEGTSAHGTSPHCADCAPGWVCPWGWCVTRIATAPPITTSPAATHATTLGLPFVNRECR